MAADSWVSVAGSIGSLADAIDQVLSDSSDEFMKSLGLVRA